MRRVVFTEAPELGVWAGRAQRIGNEVYPRLVAMLTDSPEEAPREIDVVFKRKLSDDNRGVASGKTVYINASCFASDTNGAGSYISDPVNFDKVFIHELAHIATSRTVRRLSEKSPGHWAEGLADYARYKLGYANGWSYPECGTEYPHYTSGYRCAGAFLLHLDAVFGSNAVRRLASELRRNSYSDNFFVLATGRTLEELWTEFKRTPAYLPIADETFRVHQALGYVRGRPPRDLGKQVLKYLKSQPGGVLTLEAGNFLRQLTEQNRLPGVPAADADGKRRHFTLSIELAELLSTSDSQDCPVSRRLYGRLGNDTNRLYYVAGRASRGDSWRLEKALARRRAGVVYREFSRPVRHGKTPA